MDALRDGSIAKPSSFAVTRRLSAQGFLIVAEIGMATVLFIGGGLMMRSFVKLTRVDPGYRSSNVLTFQVGVPGEQSSTRQLKAFADDLLARLRSLPDVQAVAYANQLPTVNLRDTAGGLYRTPDANRRPSPDGADARIASQDYLKVMGIRVSAGRGFSEQDTKGRPRVLLVNETLARNEFARENPVGQNVFIGRDPVPWTIVGVVADVRQFGLDQTPEPQFFADLRQWPETGTMPTFPVGPYYAVRTSGNPTSAIPYVRSLVRQLNPQATLDNVATLDQIVANSMMRPRLYAVLLTVFAGVAVGLAAIGIYGVMAYSVSRRTREIGVRMALGAGRADVLGLVLRQSGTLTIAGMVIGLAGAVGLSRYLAGLLFATTPFDAATLSIVLLTFAAIATLAAYVPASRATRVDPAVALRCE
jgi:putative ABC transport system permease protein